MPIVPHPASLQLGDDVWRLTTGQCLIQYTAGAEEAARVLQLALQQRFSMPTTLEPDSGAVAGGRVLLDLSRAGVPALAHHAHAAEGYELTVASTAGATVTAATSRGLLNGVQSLLQLVQPGPAGGAWHIQEVQVGTCAAAAGQLPRTRSPRQPKAWCSLVQHALPGKTTCRCPPTRPGRRATRRRACRWWTRPPTSGGACCSTWVVTSTAASL